jgi:alkylhydroperoxidase family enzyme
VEREMPIPLLSADDSLAAAERAGIPAVLAGPNLLRFGLRHPKLARVLADMIDVAVLNGALDARLREVAILRVGWRIGSVYEWSNHVPIARRAGMTDDELLAVRTADASVLRPGDLVAIAVADDVLDSLAVSSITFDSARQLLGDGDELLELVAIPGFYRAIGSLLLTFDIPLESHVEPWAPDGRGPQRPNDG